MVYIKLLFVCSFQIVILIESCLSSFLYPELQNIAFNKPIQLEPKQVLCGTESKVSLCDNRLEIGKTCDRFSNSIIYCDQSCPHGTVFRKFSEIERLDLLKLNPCIIIDRSYFMKNSTINYSYFFSSTLCNSNKSSTWLPFVLNSIARNLYGKRSLSANNADENEGLTLLFWFQQVSNRNGTIIHMTNDKDINLLKLVVNSVEQRLYIKYAFNKEEISVDLKNKIRSNRWNFFAFKIFKNQVNLFINEPLNLNDTLTIETIYLKMNLGNYLISNSKKINVLMGTDIQGDELFYGWIQDVLVLADSLSNREIFFKFNEKKLLTDVWIQPECKCPNDYPRNEDIFSYYCLRNDDINFEEKKVSYLNNYAHPLEFINDNSFGTSWISSTLSLIGSDNSPQPIKIRLDFLNGIYILNRIEIYYTSIPPTDIQIERFIDDEWKLLQKYSTKCVTNDTSCRRLPRKLTNVPPKGYTIIWTINSFYDKNGTNDEIADFIKAQMSNISFVDKLRASQIRLTFSGFYDEIISDSRKLYYSISEIKVFGYCDCNGFAENCDVVANPYKCNCARDSFTQGNKCEECQPFYNNQEYKTRYENLNYVCAPCNCNLRSDICSYDKSIKSGVCLKCINNTEGNNCELCKQNYYYDTAGNTCIKCNCNPFGSITNRNCDSLGRCSCKQNVEGIKCDKCKPEFFNLTVSNPFGCTKCSCNEFGTIKVNGTLSCDQQNGQCICKNKNIEGTKCDKCIQAFYNLTNDCLNSCGCDPYGSVNPFCDLVTGDCLCKRNVIGRKCTNCQPGYYNLTFSGCLNKCQCNPIGSLDLNCNPLNGICKCREGYTGSLCNECSDGYFSTDSITCQKCTCNPFGTLNSANICDKKTGHCQCKENVEGENCNTCKKGYWGISQPGSTSKVGCKKCDCDSSGIEPDAVDFETGAVLCHPVTGQCTCKAFRDGQRCDQCIVGYFLVNIDNVDCLKCGCEPSGSVAGTFCDKFTGECVCKTYNGIGGTRCNECLPGFYEFNPETGQCSRCDCNPAGSLYSDCDTTTGQCECKSFVTGTKCNKCIPSTSNLNINNPYGCSKKPTQQPPPVIQQINLTTISITWTLPDYPNGLISFYLLRRNGLLLANSTSGRTVYLDSTVSPYTQYSYTIESFNDQGSALSKPAFILTLSGRPCCGFYFDLAVRYSRRVTMRWSLPQSLNGKDPSFYISVFYREFGFEKLNFTLELSYLSLIYNGSLKNDIITYSIEGLKPYTEYSVTVKICNQDSSDKNCLSGLNNNTNSMENPNKIILITQQDAPEIQQQPEIIEINSTSVVLAIRKPLQPNGILILYEVWLKKYNQMPNNLTIIKSEKGNIGYLVCAIEEWYDPLSTNALKNFNKTKQCVIKDLKPFSLYSVVVSSSTSAGHGFFSAELKFVTREDIPLCPPVVTSAFSNSSKSIFLNWEPAKTTNNNSWIECTQGNIKEFRLFVSTNTSSVTLTEIYKGPKNEYVVLNLVPLKTYNFKVSLCNEIGCIQTRDFITVTTKLAQPGKNQSKPDYSIVNSTHIHFVWNENVNDNDKTDNTMSLKYKLERSHISFAFPPTKLESGIRFHGLNYYNFSSAQFYPEGYPFFGFKFSFRTHQEMGLVYFAGSSEAQDEFSAIQFSSGSPFFLSNTQANVDGCFITTSNSESGQLFNDNNWYTVKAIRVENNAFLQTDKQKEFKNASCSNDVVDGVTGVFIGGLPNRFLKLDESIFNSLELDKIQRKNFIGCLRNLSTLANYSVTDHELYNSQFSEIQFDFSTIPLNPGEPVETNAWYGCPIDLDTENDPFYFLGYGFLKIRYKQDTYGYLLSFEIEFRTETSEGILFLAYDPTNFDFLMINLLNSTTINVLMGYRASLNSETQGRYLNLFYNNLFNIDDLNNGYWNTLKVNLNLKKYRLTLSLNDTSTVTDTILDETAIKNLTSDGSLTLELFIYLSAGHYFGGFDMEEAKNLISYYIDYNSGFRALYNYLIYNEQTLYFSGCLRNLKINDVLVNPVGSTDIETRYLHVRFDGCPPTYKFNIANRIHENRETIYDGELTFANDSNFQPSTEYFYRVIAYNSEGLAYSNWILIRTPDSKPLFSVDTEFINVKITNGHSMKIVNISNYCFYCASKQMNSEIFTGIVTTFSYEIDLYNHKNRTWVSVKTQNFTCDVVCLIESEGMRNSKNSYGNIENLMVSSYDSAQFDIYVDTIPMEKYAILVSVCTNGGCAKSEPFEIITPQEVPALVNPPYVYKKTTTMLYLKWNEPDYPNGNITGYVLKLVNSYKILPIYTGLLTEYKLKNLEPFTKYTFYLEACNKIGCNISANVTHLTAEMAPQNVQEPEILNINQNSLLVRWTKPADKEIQNGVIRYYILYINEVFDSLANRTNLISLVYNVSTCTYCSFLIQNVRNLTAGTTYRVKLGVCTGGGCKNSTPVIVATLEKEPDVDDVIISSPLKTSTALQVSWNNPRYPNGKILSYKLYFNSDLVFEGLNNTFWITNLSPYSFYEFYLIVCNNISCSTSRRFSLHTDEAPPEGFILLEAQAIGERQITLKWSAPNEKTPFIPNGLVLFYVFAEGPFLNMKKLSDKELLKKTSRLDVFVETKRINLLNATKMNIKYGIMEKILPFSEYYIQINASNTQGFILSNRVKVFTPRSKPDLTMPPVLVKASSKSLKLKWTRPILINSEDTQIFYQVEYRSIIALKPDIIIDSKVFSVFKNATILTEYTIENLEPYSGYIFRLIATNSFGSDISDWSENIFTGEEFPTGQNAPEVLDFNDTSACLEWEPPKFPNGEIRHYRILVLKGKSNIRRTVDIYEVNSTINSFIVQNLTPFSYYSFAIESCNSVGCASSLTGTEKQNNNIKTLAAKPEMCVDPILFSENSFTIKIEWRPPVKENGILSYYIVERVDFPTEIDNDNEANIFNISLLEKDIKKYRFKIERFNFTNYDDIEPCRFYAYRILAFNQIGNCKSNWKIIQTKSARPVIVTMPKVRIVNSTTAVFDWEKPLTYCKITSYTLIFQSLVQDEFNYKMEKNITESIMIKAFQAFTNYTVRIRACVDSKRIECTGSLAKSFKTPGSAPSKIKKPILRLVKPNMILIQWAEPQFQNGPSLAYQLLRKEVSQNFSKDLRKQDINEDSSRDIVYLGNETFFIDSNLKENSVYKYMIICGNGFGYSLSNWSSEVNTFKISQIAEESPLENELNKTTILFDLKAVAESPSSIYLKWNNYENNELRIFLNALINKRNQTKHEKKFKYINGEVIEIQVLISRILKLKSGFSKSKYITAKMNASTDDSEIIITHLYPNTNYIVSLLAIFNGFDDNKTEISFMLKSEITKCKTLSIDKIYPPSEASNKKQSKILELFQINKTFATLSYRLTDVLIKSYDYYQIIFNQNIIHVINKTSSKINEHKSGSFIYGAIQKNQQHLFMMKACYKNDNMLKFDGIFIEGNCIKLISLAYSVSTKSPEGLSDLEIDVVDTNRIELSWKEPENSNGYLKEFIVYKRIISPQSKFINDETICFQNKTIDSYINLFNPFKNASFDLSKMIIKCGGQYYRMNPNYQCCLNLYYVKVPPNQICCPFYDENKTFNESYYQIGFGNYCCSVSPFYTNSAQKCCADQLFPQFQAAVTTRAQVPTVKIRELDCEANNIDPLEYDRGYVQQIYKGLNKKYLDTSINSFMLYQYKLCVKNAFGTRCNDKWLNKLAEEKLPDDFDSPDYVVYNDTQIVIKWRPPRKPNGVIRQYRLYRDSFEIYTGNHLYFVDSYKNIGSNKDKNSIIPYTVYEYSLSACNKKGCTNAVSSIFVATKEKLSEIEKIHNLSVLNSTSLNISWCPPTQPNGIIRKYIISVKEIHLDIEIYMDSKSSLRDANVSAKNFSMLKYDYLLFKNSLTEKNKIIYYYVVITDLKPAQNYTISFSYCNNIGCRYSKNIESLSEYSRVKTFSYQPTGFADPIIFLKTSTSSEIIWQKPKHPNGEIVKYILYRNNLLHSQFESAALNDNELYYSYIDDNLKSNKYYSYSIEVVNSAEFTTKSSTVSILTLDENFNQKCLDSRNITEDKMFISSLTGKSASILIFKTLNISFESQSSNEISVEFNLFEWESFLKCILNNTTFIFNDVKNSSIYSSKLILYAKAFGLQTIEFPLFSTDFQETTSSSLNRTVKQKLVGLKPNTNYSIRFTITSNFDSKRILTTDSIFLRTFENKPCCKLESPKVKAHRYKQNFIVRWKAPEFQNGKITYYVLNRTRLKGFGCDSIKINEIDEYIEESSRIKIMNFEDGISMAANGLKYDELNEELIYVDNDETFLNKYAYYSYQIIALNRNGNLESPWSKPTLIWQFKPNPPTETIIRNVHSSGFTVKFKIPGIFNGVMAFYRIGLVQLLTGNNSEKKLNITVKADISCKNSSDLSSLFVSVPISGLEPYKSYKITITSVNSVGMESDESESIVGNTLQSSPSNLESFSYELEKNDSNSAQSIIFKFREPGNPNGVITSYILYQVTKGGKQQKQLYNGPNREYKLDNIQPFTQYAFLYSVCTIVGCTVQANSTVIRTLESKPELQNPPKVKQLPNSDCVNISWTYPRKPNGLIKRFELYKRLIDKSSHFSEGSQTELLDIFKTLNQTKHKEFHLRDCNLTLNTIIFYKIRSYNNAGFAESNYSEPIELEKTMQNFFNELILNQWNHSAIVLMWPSSKSYGDDEIYYHIYRNRGLVDIIKVTKPSYNINKYIDYFNLLPKTFYTYIIYGCKSRNYCKNRIFNSTILTKDQPPVAVMLPMLANISSNEALINTTNIANLSSDTQSIVEYRLYLNQNLYYSGNDTLIRVRNLSPYTNYTIVVEACTYFAQIVNNILEKGCKHSSKLFITTLQASPEFLDPPIFQPLKSNDYKAAVLIKWNRPNKPNGVLKLCELKRNNITVLSTVNMNVITHTENQLNYGAKYIYELKYENDAGYVSVRTVYVTNEVTPKLIEPPLCQTLNANKIRLNWTEPEYPNGIIIKYIIIFQNVEDIDKLKNLTISNDNLNTYILTSLKPFTEYSFQIGACNSKGCAFSKNNLNSTCKTFESFPQGMDPPVCNQSALDNNTLAPVIIDWSSPKIPNGIIISYSLFRISVGELSNKSDLFYQKNLSEKMIYKGDKTKYIDYDVIPFNAYKYSVEAENSVGSVKSNWTLFYTNPIKPNMLINPGRLLKLTNRSVTISLEKPKQVNGLITKITIKLFSKALNKTYLVYTNAKSSFNLEKIINQTTLSGLLNNTNYELQSEFCNQVACVQSEHKIQFKTLKNEEIRNYEAINVASTYVQLKWDFEYEANPLLNETISNITFEVFYEIVKMNNTKKLIYKGNERSVNIKNLVPFTNYSFQLLVFKESNNQSKILNITEAIRVQTLADKPVFINLPTVSILKNQTFLQRLDINWENSFKLNGPLIKYLLTVNNVTIYDGSDTRYRNDFVIDCNANLLKVGSVNVELEFSSKIIIEVYTTEDFITKEFYSIEYNCTTPIPSSLISTTKSILSEYWFLIVVVCTNVVIITVILWILLSFYGKRKSKKTSKNEIIETFDKPFEKSIPKTIKIQKHLFQDDTQSEMKYFINNNEDLSLVELLNYGEFFNESTNSLNSVQKPIQKIIRLDDFQDTRI